MCFARVLVADPRIFVLDEATSSIDTETEQLIQSAIHTVLRGRTSFVVAHRLSTVRTADKILVIDAGRIAEAGTHDELMAQKGRYYSLYTHQYRARPSAPSAPEQGFARTAWPRPARFCAPRFRRLPGVGSFCFCQCSSTFL